MFFLDYLKGEVLYQNKNIKSNFDRHIIDIKYVLLLKLRAKLPKQINIFLYFSSRGSL